MNERRGAGHVHRSPDRRAASGLGVDGSRRRAPWRLPSVTIGAVALHGASTDPCGPICARRMAPLATVPIARSPIGHEAADGCGMSQSKSAQCVDVDPGVGL